MSPVSARLQSRAQGPRLEGSPASHLHPRRSKLLKKSEKKDAGSILYFWNGEVLGFKSWAGD